VEVLFDSSEARSNAVKIILLFTDGVANVTRHGRSDVRQAQQDALEAARDARARGVRIYTVSVGAGADQDLMEELAETGDGEQYHAGGDKDEYTAQLQKIFQQLGGKRPVILIE
jgi:Mg-chelatase subunit ChlD